MGTVRNDIDEIGVLLWSIFDILAGSEAFSWGQLLVRIFPVLEIDAFCCFSWGQRMSRLPGLVRAGLHGPV